MNWFSFRLVTTLLQQIFMKKLSFNYVDFKSAYGTVLIENRYFLIMMTVLRLLASVFDVLIGYALLLPDAFQQHFDLSFHNFSTSAVNTVFAVLFCRIFLFRVWASSQL